MWSTDITYIPMRGWLLYLTAVIDWYSRYVLSWRLSNTLDGAFLPGGVGRGVGMAGRRSSTRTGVAVHGAAFTGRLDGRDSDQHGRSGRALDNVFVERLWRTVKYEEVYLKDYRMRSGVGVGADEFGSGSTTTRGRIRASSTGRQPRSIRGPGFTGAERGKALTNAGGLSGPSFGVHYNHSTADPPAWALRRPTASAGGITAAGKPGHKPH